MAITDAFTDAVQKNDIRSVRIMMKNSMLFDPTFEELNEMDRIAGSKLHDLYDVHDGSELNDNSAAWDEDYMDKLMVQVVGNFSHERVALLKKIVGKLRPVETRPQQPKSANRPGTRRTTVPPKGQASKLSYEEQKRLDEQSGNIASLRGGKIAAGAVVGGVVGGAIAGLASASVIAGATAGAVVVGVAVAVATNGEG